MVDYDLNNFHADKYLSLFRGDLANLGVEVAAAYGMIEDASKEWTQKNDVTWAASPEAAIAEVDAVLLLAPNNAEVHPALAERVFPAAKPVYVDKTFSANPADSDVLVGLAEDHQTPVFSSSALRFTPALREYLAEGTAPDVIDAEGRGPGEWPVYGVHTVEPLITVMGPDLRRLRAGGREKLIRVELEWEDGRTGLATVNKYGAPFHLTLTTKDGLQALDLNDPTFYNGLVEAMVEFFRTSKSPVPLSETVAVMQVLHRMEESLTSGGWVNL